ncbi:hypothetical protein [Nocardiopsis sp. CNT312]|uniref:hypothetical protein n=1 Tax=Nocardiopsis sp. CNT312 TaxID=1137268 RepID=UPI001E4A12ED|nr:hypothetical protein [Nocardiopsis sp. CNT312]
MSTDVPIPGPIRRLPTTRAGYPIPVLTPRGDMSATFTIKELPDTGLTAVCPCRDHDQPHKLGAICPDLQRSAMRRHRCGVCGTRLDPRSGLAFIRDDPYTLDFIEPPLHPRCMAYSARVCPVLARSIDTAQILICRRVRLYERRETASQDGQRTVHRYFPLGDGQGRRFGALVYLVAVPVNPEVHPCAAWLDQHAPPLS